MVSVPTSAEISAIGSNFVQTMYIIILILLGITILSVLVYRLTFKCKVRLRYLTGSNDKVKDCCGKLIKDKTDGIDKFVVMFKLFKTFKMPAPPAEAISLNMRGKDCYEIEVPPNGSPRYIIKDKTKNRYMPFDTNDKVFLLNEEQKRLARKTKNVYDVIGQAIPYIFMLIVFIGLIAFWGEIVAPFQEETAAARAYQLEWQQEASKITSMLKEIIAKEQILSGEVEIVPPAEVLTNSSIPPE